MNEIYFKAEVRETSFYYQLPFFLLQISVLSQFQRAVVEEFCQLGQCLLLEHLNLSYRDGDVGTIFIVVIATEQKPNLKAKKHSCSVVIFLMLLT